MTDRERWTVYPLLFLALGITVKDKLPPRIANVDEVRCGKIFVTDRSHRERVVIATSAEGGIVQLQGNKSGLVFLDSRGNLLSVLGPNLGVQTGTPRQPPDAPADPTGDELPPTPQSPPDGP